MSLSPTQITQIRHYLGYPDNWRDLNTTLESQFASISAEAQTLITAALTASPPGILASLMDIDARLSKAPDRLKALRVGSIELPGRGEIDMLRSEGRRLVKRLATIFHVAVFWDVFSEDTPDDGNFIPLG